MHSLRETRNLDITEQAWEKINFGENLMKAIEEFKNIEGSQKLYRKINQELRFLKKVLKSNTLKKEHLQCSNLTHFAAVIEALKTVENCKSISKIFIFDNKKVTVDIVSDGGLTWTKVVARNPKSLSQICMGNASYGVRSVIDQAEEFIECAKLHPCLFQTPKIIFIFTNGVSHNVANKLESYGIVVKGTRLQDFHQLVEDDFDTNETGDDIQNYNTDISSITELTTKNVSSINKINLDVSAMLAYCSSVTNGSAELYDFDVPVLKQQAEWERLRPQKPILEKFFEGKKVYCCQTARDNFENIVKTVGGPNEKVHAEELLKRLLVLPDDADYRSTCDSEEFDEVFDKVQFTNSNALKVGGKIRQRSLTIFTFGDRIRAVTVSANDGFVRAAKQQGINFVVFIHESRALTEQKEKANAIPIAK